MDRILSDAAINYIIKQLLQRIGIIKVNHSLFNVNNTKLYFQYCDLDCIDKEKRGIVVIPCDKESWDNLLNHKSNYPRMINVNQILPSGKKLPFDGKVPIILSKINSNDSFVFEDNEYRQVILFIDIFAITFFLLTRYEETIITDRDEHNRFPATASLAFKQGFLDQPVVDQYALILQTWIMKLVPTWEPKSERFSIRLSHDIDTIKFPTIIKLTGDILKRHNFSQAARTIKKIAKSEKDPYFQGILKLADLSKKVGLQSVFYLMTANKSRRDSGYFSKEPAKFKEIITYLRDQGHEIGFHSSYVSFDNPKKFILEKERMESALGHGQFGGRQHYLRFSVPDTWRVWEETGLEHDSTMCFADHEGFRCGTCHPFHPFDIQNDREMDILEIPFVVMDATLRVYRGLSPKEGAQRIITLAKRCRQVNGVFTLLWHNTSTCGDWSPWFTEYELLLPELRQLECAG